MINSTLNSIASLRANNATLSQTIYITGYYAPMDGGGGLFTYVSTDTTSVDNAGTIIVDASNCRWYRQINTAVYNVRWFGARVDGITDDTAAASATFKAAAAINGTAEVPMGIMIISSITINLPSQNLVIRGAGMHATIIKTTSATLNIFSLTLGFLELRNFGLSTTVTRTAGAHLQTITNICNIIEVNIDGYFRGILGGDNEGTFRDVLTTNPAANAIAVIVNGYPVSLLIDNLNCYQGKNQAYAGIEVLQCGELNLVNSGIVGQGIDLLIGPGNGQTAAAVFCTNTFFDTAGTGVYISPTGTGSVVRAKFTSCWSCSHINNGVTIQNNGTGILQGIEFDNHMGCLNGGSGISIIAGSGAPTGVNIVGGTFAGNAAGILIGAAVTDFSIIGTQCGAYGGIGGNSAAGIIVSAGASNRYIISNNRTSGNPSGISDGGTGTNKFVGNNIT